MSGYKGHIIGGAGAGVASAYGIGMAYGSHIVSGNTQVASIEFLSVMIVISILFGLWPDVDTNSKGQDIFYSAIFILDILLIMGGYMNIAAYLGLLAMLPVLGKHRGWTHSRITMLLVPLPFLIIPVLEYSKNYPIGIALYGAAVAGYASHLLLDGLLVRWIRFKG